MKLNYLFENENDETEEREVLWALMEKHPKIKEILKSHGVKINKLKCIGGTTMGTGSQGQAYSDGSLVVKITEDETEAQASEAVMRAGGVQGISKVHFVGRLSKPFKWPYGLWASFPDEPGPQFYIIILELLDTRLSKKEIAVIDSIEIGKEFYQKIGQLRDKKPSAIAHKLAGEIATDDYSLNIISKLYEALIRLYFQANVKYFDIRSDNVGKSHTGEYYLFDLGVSQTDRHYKHTAIESKIPII